MTTEPPEDVLGIRQRPTLELQPLGEYHRITTRARDRLARHHRCNGKELTKIIAEELATLTPIALIAHQHDRILVTNYDFNAPTSRERLTYHPNEKGGLTIMLGDER